MALVRLTRRLGLNQPDTVIDRSDEEASWLVSHGYAIPEVVELMEELDNPLVVTPRPPARRK